NTHFQDKEKKLSHSPLVSIIVPIYNVEKYLRQCLDSIINQTYKNLKIILINDGSTDNSSSIAKDYFCQDNRVVLIEQENCGQSVARNTGVQYLKNNILNKKVKKIYTKADIKETDYIMFLDSDDYLEFNCIEECVKRMQKFGCDIVWFDYTLVKEKDIGDVDYIPNIRSMQYNKEEIISNQQWSSKILELNKTCFWFVVDGMIDFNFLKKTNLNFREGFFYEDTQFGIMLFSQAQKIYVFPEQKYYYRIHSNSTMQWNKTIKFINPYIKPILTEFNNNVVATTKYHRAASWFMVMYDLMQFAKENNDDIKNMIKKQFLHDYWTFSQDLFYFSKDPLNILEKVQQCDMDLTNLLKDKRPWGGAEKVQRFLSYKLGIELVNTKNTLDFITIPVRLFFVLMEYKKMEKNFLINKKRFSCLNSLPSLQDYEDQHRIQKVKSQLSYKLGNLLIKYPFTFIFRANKVYKDWKREKGRG
ncbi:glycosyltransferase family 2 protein, partial [Campylobacter coli]|uniref:glycosyltransferase family 2 protein n=1 Tax=Campylobacter coli TaxID=195 RepID=UPI003CE8FA00